MVHDRCSTLLTGFSTALTTILPILFQYCYKCCYIWFNPPFLWKCRTKSGSLRFSQFSGCWLICLFIYLWVLTFPLENFSEFGNFVITLIYSLRNMWTIKYTKTIWYWGTNINESSLYPTCIIQSLTDNWIINYKIVLPYACMHIFQRKKLFPAQARYTRIDTTLCDKVCQWLATGRWFSLDTPVSSTNKTDSHDITEIWLKVALNTITSMKSYLAHSI